MEKIISNAIKSILIGTLFCILLGYVFSNTTYYYKGVEVYEETKKTVEKEEFNFKVGLISGVITILVLFLLVFDDKKRDNVFNFSNGAFRNLKSPKIQKPRFTYLKSFMNSDGSIGRTEYVVKLILLNFISYLIFQFFIAYLDFGVVSRIIFVSVFGLLSLFIHFNLMLQRINDTNLSIMKVIIYSILLGGVIFPFMDIENYLMLLYVFYFVLFLVILFLYPSSKKVD